MTINDILVLYDKFLPMTFPSDGGRGEREILAAHGGQPEALTIF